MFFLIVEAVLLSLTVGYICYKYISKNFFAGILCFLCMIIFCTVKIAKNEIVLYDYFLSCMVSILCLTALYDYKYKEIPNVLLIIINILGLISSIVIPEYFFLKSIICAAVVSGICFLIGKKSKNEIGLGDIFTLSGLIMSITFSHTVNMMFSALLVSVLYGIISVILKRKTWKTAMAFVPFLLFGYIYSLCIIWYI